MQGLVYFLLHYAAVCLLAVLSYGLGRLVTWRLAYRSRFEQISYSITLGLGILAYVVLLFGLLGLLYKWVLLTAFICIFVACYRVWWTWIHNISRTLTEVRWRSAKPWIVLAALIVGGAIALPVLAGPLYPPNSWDAVSYHLVVAKTYVQEHTIRFLPYVVFPVFPQTNQMLFSLALALYDDIFAQLIQLLILITLGICVTAFARQAFSARAGWFAAALLIASPKVLWLGSVAYVDIALMLFVTMAVYAFWRWKESGEGVWLALAGVFCGFAVGTKYPAVVVLLTLQVQALWVGWRARQYIRPFILSAVALLVASPWIARNVYYTGNPVFPFFNRLFGQLFSYRQWPPEYLAGLYENFSFAGFSGPGIGHSLRSLVTLPWHLSFNQPAFGGEPPLTPAFFFVVPFLLFAIFADRRVRWLLVIVCVFVLYWFYTIQLSRYLMPVLPLLCVAAAGALDYTFSRISVLRRWSGYILTLIAIPLMAEGWLYAESRLRAEGPVPVTSEQRDAYLARRIPAYTAVQFLNHSRESDYTLFSVFCGDVAYFVNGTYMGMQYGPASYDRVGGEIIGERGLSLRGMSYPDGRELYTRLRGLGVDFLVLHKRLPITLPEDEFFRSHFKVVYAQGGVSAYELSESP